MSTLEFKRSGI